MVNVIEIGKASVTAYNDKNWSKAKDSLAADAVYDEKGTHRRIQGAGEIIEAWQGWAKAFPNSKATIVREFASGDTAVFELIWKGVHSGPTPLVDQGCERREGQEHLALLRYAHAAGMVPVGVCSEAA